MKCSTYSCVQLHKQKKSDFVVSKSQSEKVILTYCKYITCSIQYKGPCYTVDFLRTKSLIEIKALYSQKKKSIAIVLTIERRKVILIDQQT
jgi:hypothetical protein